MFEISKTALQPGMILAKDVIFQGNFLYPAGYVINEPSIQMLNRFPIQCVTIMEDSDYATSEFEKIKFNEGFKAFENEYNACLVKYKKIIHSFLVSGTVISNDELIDIFDTLNAKIPSGKALLDYLYHMVANEDELTFTHTMNSVLFAGAVADWCGLETDVKRNLILCCFYYDIGKLKIPYELLWKPGRLTMSEFNMVKTHPLIGHSLVHFLPIDDNIRLTILQHHERYDGSGYPEGMVGDDINMYARYVAIIDAYIAMASPRTYRNAMTPLTILGNFEKNLRKYDVALLLPLLRKISDSQIGSKIMLSDYSVWEVFIIHPNHYSRPLLKNSDNVLLDLADYPNLKIINIL